MRRARRATGVRVHGSASGPIPQFIEIIAPPPGEPPKDVRQAWVGLTLPLAVNGAHKYETMGALSGPKSNFGTRIARWLGRFEMMKGYLVDAHVAVERLADHAPEAADWWRSHAPHLIAPGRNLIFPALVARPVAIDLPSPANEQ